MNEFDKFKDEELEVLKSLQQLKSLIFSNIKTIITFSILIMSLTIFYLHFTPKQYNTFSKIKILEEEETSAFVLEDMMSFDSPFSSEEELENEIEILKSKSILESVIQELRLTNKYSNTNVFSNNLVEYHSIPYISIISRSPHLNYKEREFTIECIDYNKFEIINQDDIKMTANFGETFILSSDTINIQKSSDFILDEVQNTYYKLTVFEPFQIFINLSDRIKISPITDNILSISLEGNDPDKDVKIIETLLNNYNEDHVKDEKIVSESTSYFLKVSSLAVKKLFQMK